MYTVLMFLSTIYPFSPYVNTYKPSVLFVGHRQPVQTQIRRRRTRRLIRVSTVCLQNISLKENNEKKLPDTPIIGNGLVQWIRVGKSIRLKWVKGLMHHAQGPELQCLLKVKENLS